MAFSIIAAIAANGVIGKNNKLPWHIPEELAHFYSLIYGKPVVMGRKTFASIGTPLSHSQNIVLSANPKLKLPGCQVYNSRAAILTLFSREVEVMVIGGAAIYREFLPVATTMYLTLLEQEITGDRYFPKWHPELWHIVKEEQQASGPYSWRYLTLIRRYPK